MVARRFGSLGFLEVILLITACIVLVISLGVVGWAAYHYFLVEPALTAVAIQPAGLDDWQAIQSKGIIAAGVSGNYYPFAYYKEGRLEGYDVALMSSIAHEMGLEIDWVELPVTGYGTALRLRQIDTAISALSIVPDILTFSDLSPAYFIGEDSIITVSAIQPGQIQQLDDLSDLRTGVLKDSLFQSILLKTLIRPGLMSLQNLFEFGDYEEAAIALLENRIDVIYLDAVDGERLAQEKGFILAGKGIEDLQYRIAVRKGSQEFLNQVMAAYERLNEQGRINQLQRQYLIPAYVSPQPLSQRHNLTATATPLPAVMPECLDGMEVIEGAQQPASLIRVLPGQVFTKSWQIKNTGTCTWTSSYSLVFAYGNSPAARMGSQPVNIDREILPGISTEIFLPFIAAQDEGYYQGFWNLVSPKNKPFGERIELQVVIQTELPLTSTGTLPSDNPPELLTNQVLAPNILSFNIAPSEQIYQGECVLVQWSVEGQVDRNTLTRNDVELLSEGPSSGEYFDCPALLGTVVYAISSEGPGGLDQRQEDVNIFSPPSGNNTSPTPAASETPNLLLPVIISFDVTPKEVFRGECVLLQWKMGENTSQVSLYRDERAVLETAPLAGMAQDCLQAVKSVSYRLVAANQQGQTVEQEVLINVVAP